MSSAHHNTKHSKCSISDVCFYSHPPAAPTAPCRPLPAVPSASCPTTSSGLCSPCSGFWQRLRAPPEVPHPYPPLSLPLESLPCPPQLRCSPRSHQVSCSKHSLYCVLACLPPSLKRGSLRTGATYLSYLFLCLQYLAQCKNIREAQDMFAE